MKYVLSWLLSENRDNNDEKSICVPGHRALMKPASSPETDMLFCGCSTWLMTDWDLDDS